MDTNASVTDNMALINELTGEYPLYLRQIRKMIGAISLPKAPTIGQVRSLGFYPVMKTTRPTGVHVVEGTPEKTDGVYHQTWSTRPFTEQELEQQLAQLKSQYCLEANVLRDQDIENGMPYLFPNGTETETVPLKQDDQTILLTLRIKAAEADNAGITDPIFVYRTVENNIHQLTPQQMIDLTTAVTVYAEHIFVNSWAYKDAVMAAETLEDLSPVPETFAFTPE